MRRAMSAGRSGTRAESSCSKAKAASSALRVRMPGVSKLGLRGTIPAVDQRPRVVFRPTVPVRLAGMRTDPPVSVPRATSAVPSATETPAPLLDPPGARWVARSRGFHGTGWWRLVPRPPKANSTVWVLPRITADWRRRDWRMGPSAVQISGKARGVPAKVGSPVTPYRSLTDTGTPCRPPSDRPEARAASASASAA